jgi:hypothetical protein
MGSVTITDIEWRVARLDEWDRGKSGFPPARRKVDQSTRVVRIDAGMRDDP